jgi:type III secretory pathway component EscR
MKHPLISVAVMLGLFSVNSVATEYIYRDLMANTLPLQHCDSKDKASQDAEKPYKLTLYSKKFCQTQGYGWHVEKVKNNGKLVCNECSTAENKGKYQCWMEDVVVECKRIKPGTVGLLPGKS